MIGTSGIIHISNVSKKKVMKRMSYSVLKVQRVFYKTDRCKIRFHRL